MEDKENKITSVETIAHKTPVEELVAKTEEALEMSMHHPGSHTFDTEELHSYAVSSDFGSVYEKYENHEVFNLSDIRISIVRVLATLAKEKSQLKPEYEEYKEAEKYSNLLKDRTDFIESSIHSYVKTLQQFFLIKKQQFRLSPEDYLDKIRDIDSRRRQAHNALIESLTVYTRIIETLEDQGFLEDLKIQNWNFGFKPDISFDDPDTIMIFSDQFLSDRDLIKDWALSAHVHQQLAKIDKLQNSGTE